jgi:hypothetical protein
MMENNRPSPLASSTNNFPVRVMNSFFHPISKRVNIFGTPGSELRYGTPSRTGGRIV